MITIGINGVAGRMGQAVSAAAEERDAVEVAFGIDDDPEETTGPPVVGPPELEETIASYTPDVIVDFSVPEATLDLATVCADAGVPLVIGTTGFDTDALERLEALSAEIPVLKAANFARGIQAFLRALEPALAALEGYDIELAETHHNAKVDAPSGTANTILETIRDHRDLEPVYGRNGHQPRSDNEVGVLVSRLGDVRGEHEVRLGANDEVLTIAHRAEDRGVFAAGALDAAVWLAEQNPGWYTFGDVIDET
ncbi:MAG: 4-hydroxy-tetrahydrodipicolinate reductase [Salinirussus sp.]